MGNIIIQWGYIKLTSNETKVIFKKPYSNNCSIQISHSHNSFTSDGWEFHTILRHSLKDFVVYGADIDSAYIMWLAIGY